MVENIKISARQFAILVILFSVGTTILVIPGSLANEVKQDAWIAALIGTAFSFVFVALYLAVARMFPTMTLVEIIETLLGKWLGKAVSLTFVFFSFYNASDLLYYAGIFLTTEIIPDTPHEAIHILCACILIMGIRLGLETLARSAELLFPVFILLLLLLVLSILVTPDLWKVENIQPMFHSGVKPMIRAVLLFSSTFTLPLIVLLMIFPKSINKIKKAEKNFFIAILIAGVCLIVLILLTILVLGPDLSARRMYPSYILAKSIRVGNFLQRIEAILAIMWLITIYFKMSIYFYAVVIGFVQTLKSKDYRSYTLPLGMILVTTSLFSHPNVAHSAKYDHEIWPFYALTYGLVLPILLLVINKLRKIITNYKK
ncbi:spore gernimation protein [Bacillus sp. MUM 116]|uniref:GerAB/ArcD/ProY family transporter n=1 Tax=Bacillus sp. MUM 116 TaxID=1678002 RepID=UPI0008F5D7EC|nr:endospore germination permease [Bacillus sp. MUM 116]OIK08424.1 spore gernimation protein [Bacillus sp. MUM 116]